MAYDEQLAHRIRKAIGDRKEVAEQKMFGGLAFLIRGHMCWGIVGHDLMIRVGQEDHATALSQPHVRPMDFTGRPSKGMVYVAPGGVRTDAALRQWIDRAIGYGMTLPPKSNRPAEARRRTRS